MPDRVATDIGIAWSKRYSGIHPGRGRGRLYHAVVKSDDHAEKGAEWSLLCSGMPAMREYKGWTTNVDCRICIDRLKPESEGR